MKKLFLFLIAFACLFQNRASGQTLHGDYGGTVSRKFYIGVYRDGSYQLVDSLIISDRGTISVPLRDEWRGVIIVACGDYVKSWEEAFRNANPETSLQFVFEGQDITYKTSWRHQSYPTYLQYGEGTEATVALKSLNTQFNALQERIYYMEQLLKKTPQESEFQTALQQELSYSAEKFNLFVDSVTSNFKGLPFMTLYSQMFKQVMPPASVPLNQRAEWTAQHLFDYTDLQNPLTANVPLFMDKIHQYLYLNTPAGGTPTAAIERLQAKMGFPLPPLPSLQSREQQLRNKVLTTNMDELYGSPGYHDTVNSWLVLYNVDYGKFPGMFAEDMLTVLDRIKSPEAFTGFANDLLVISTKFGWDNEGTKIAEYLYQNQSRLKNPTGVIRKAISNGRLQPGMPAPAIAGAELTQKTLLVFYESGCNSCENEMRQLVANYSVLKENGIEVISISSDNAQIVFEQHSKDFPWMKKLCDFKGVEGENFKNYGVMGTPTFFVIDATGIILGKYPRLIDTGLLN